VGIHSHLGERAHLHRGFDTRSHDLLPYCLYGAFFPTFSPSKEGKDPTSSGKELAPPVPLLVATLVKKCEGTRETLTWAKWTFLMVFLVTPHMGLLATPFMGLLVTIPMLSVTSGGCHPTESYSSLH
jgi:hypothetical protein